MKPINKTDFHAAFKHCDEIECNIEGIRFVVMHVDSRGTKLILEELLNHRDQLEVGETYAIRYQHEDNGIEGYCVEVFKVKDLLLDLKNLQESIFKIYTKIRPHMDSENTILHHPV